MYRKCYADFFLKLRCKITINNLLFKMVEEEPKVVLSARYSRRRAAELLGVDESTIYRMVARGDLRCKYRRNGLRFYLGGDILMAWRAAF